MDEIRPDTSPALEELDALTNQLTGILEEETALLDALDLQAAAGLLSRKRLAVAALQGAVVAGGLASAPDQPGRARLQASIARMQAVADANRVAVEQGLALQTQVIQAIATAVPRARAVEAPIYRQDGSKVPARPPEAYAFLSRM